MYPYKGETNILKSRTEKKKKKINVKQRIGREEVFNGFLGVF